MMSSPNFLAGTILAYHHGAGRYAEHSRDRDGLARLRDSLLGLLPPHPRVLDLGSGPGHDAALFAAAGTHVVALDPAQGLLREAQGYPQIAASLVVGEARELPFANESFDGVWSCASLLHVPHTTVALALSETFRVLRPGGVALFSMSEGDSSAPVAVTDLGLATRMYYYYRSADWEGLLRATGFDIVSHQAKRDAGNFNPGSTGWLESCVRKPENKLRG